ncbi:MAG: hypothetical protein ACRYFE_08880 [Janthinobacterium lividum]
MGTIIETDGDFGLLPYGLLLPVPGAVNWHDIGSTSAASAHNKADPLAPAAIVGSPTFSAAAGQFSLGNAMSTGRSDTANMTLFAVCRSSASGQVRRVITNYTDPPVHGCGFNISSAANELIAYSANTGGTATGARVAVTNPSNWFLAVMRVTEGLGTRLWNKTEGTTGGHSSTGPRVLAPGAAMRIGSSPTGGPSSAGAIEVAFAAVYESALSEGQIDAVTEFIRYSMSLKGITV